MVDLQSVFSYFDTMKRLILILATLIWLFPLSAQSTSTYSSSLAKPRLYIKGKEQNGKFLKINYEVTVSGYIELHLIKREWNRETSQFDETTVLIRGKVTENRNPEERYYKDYVSFPVGPLEEKASYRYELHYKGEVYSGSI